MTRSKLAKTFLKAQLEGLDVAIEITVPGRKSTEIIIIQHNNLDYKYNYYINNYNEELVLNRCKDIKIVNIYAIDTDIIKRMKGMK